MHLGVKVVSIKLPQRAIIWREDLTVLRINECGADVIYACAATLPVSDIPIHFVLPLQDYALGSATEPMLR